MPEYIEREAAMQCVKHAWAKGLDPTQYIELVPAADVEPVRHGRWIDIQGERNMAGGIVYADATCSICKKHTEMRHFYPILLPYCPNCGAKMDLEEVAK